MPNLRNAFKLNKPFIKRYYKNRPAVLGMYYLIIIHVLAAISFIITPDKTPNANDGSVLIRKEAPFFNATIIKIRKNIWVPKTSFFQNLLSGSESQYTIEPIASGPFIKGDSVYFKQYGRVGKEQQFLLLDCVMPLYVGEIALKTTEGFNYKKVNGTWTYVNIEGEEKKITQQALEALFWEQNIEERSYILGTDKAGRDILSRLIYGAKISLSVGFVAMLISLSVGLFFGAIAGFFGGRLDVFIQWLMTVIWSIPAIMLVITISLALQNKGIWVVFIAVGLTMWVEIARVVRGQIMGIKEKQYIEAARTLGYPNIYIIFKHIFPNILGPVLVISSANFASAILVEAGLSFLGLGVQPPMPSWGAMVNEGFRALGSPGSWHLIVLPSLSISLTVLAFNLVSNGLRDAYDPTLAAQNN